MKCKFCQAELESNSSVCPNCGKDNLKDSLKGLKITALVLVCLVLLVILAGLICYGVTGSFLPDWFGTIGGDKETHQVVTPDGVVDMTDKELEKNMDKVVATLGAYQLTNRELQLYYWIAAYNNEEVDLEKDLTTQIYDKETNQTYHEYFLESALKNWKETTMMCDAAKKAGFELSKEYTEYLGEMKEELEYYVEVYVKYYGLDLKGVDDLIRMQFGPGCDYETYYNYTYNFYYGSVYWTDLVDTLEVTDEEINEYFDENEESLAEDYDIPVTKDFGNLVDIRTILINAIVTEGENDAGEKINYKDWVATLKEANRIYGEWSGGEMTEEAFIELVKKYSKGDAAEKGGLYTDLYKTSMTEVDVRHILIFPDGATSSNVTSKEWPDSAWAFAENKAKEILAEWEKGEKTEASFGALANKYSQDQNGKVTNGGLYSDVYVGQMVKNFEDWCFDPARQPGDTGIVKTEYGYHVMYYVRADREAEDWTFDEARKPGDVGVVKTDDGYMLVYFVDAEPAWYRYSRYGAKTQKAQNQLEALVAGQNSQVFEDLIHIGVVEAPEPNVSNTEK